MNIPVGTGTDGKVFGSGFLSSTLNSTGVSLRAPTARRPTVHASMHACPAVTEKKTHAKTNCRDRDKDPTNMHTIVSSRLEAPSMDKALKLPLKQTRFGGKSKWVRCNVVLPVGSRRPENEPPDLSLQTRFVLPQTGGSEPKFRGFPVLETLAFQRYGFANR